SPIPEPAAHPIQPQEAAPAPPFPEASQPAGPPGPEQGFVGESFKQDDFIAAARRAAQAAARQPPGPIAQTVGFLGRAKAKAGKVSTGKSRFSSAFLYRGQRDLKPAEGPAEAANDGIP